MSLSIKGAFGLVGQIKGRDGVAPVIPPTGSLLWTLNNPTPASGDNFGRSVAISGNRAIVGAWRDDTGATDSGSAYIYDVTTGSLVHTINNPTPASNELFGFSVSISGDLAIVGAVDAYVASTQAGVAYIYNVTTGALVHTINNPSPNAGDSFGESVSISGNYAIVGAIGEDISQNNSGRAYIYNLNSATPTQPFHTLNNPTPGASDHFGNSVSIDGNYAIVGARYDNTGAINTGSAYIYDVTTGSLLHTLNNPTPVDYDNFGESVSISGNYAIVGAHGDSTIQDKSGAAYVFDVSTGGLLHTLTNPLAGIDDRLGYSVSISGNYAIVGAPYPDTGAFNTGSAYIFDLGSATPTVPVYTLPNPTPASSEYFGWAVAIDGNNVIVGAYNDNTGGTGAGSVYIYN